jgi:hypothetical protein
MLGLDRKTNSCSQVLHFKLQFIFRHSELLEMYSEDYSLPKQWQQLRMKKKLARFEELPE